MVNRLADIDLVVVVARIRDYGSESLTAVGITKKEALQLLRTMWRDRSRSKFPIERVSFHKGKIGELFRETYNE